MYPGGFYSQMNRREAQLILGVMEGTDSTSIKQKHRTLMLNNHPDNGGSTYLATKINEAKEMLINT
jgi:DnaJ family protein C protein 19